MDGIAGEPGRRVVRMVGEQIRKDVREVGRLHCHPFVIKKRDGGSWRLEENDLFLLLRWSEFYVLM